MSQKIQILWADDEIDLLKPHILFLKSKGYEISPVTNGEDAVEMVSEQTFDLVFLDENMPGLPGLEALARIKTIRPALPVVMITKSEEEYIMEEAIGSQIADYLIKPVNPNQILLAIKKIIDHKRLVSEKTTSGYQQDFRNLGMAFNERLSAHEWAETYQKLVHWEIELEKSKDAGMKEVFMMQKSEANRQFSKFIAENYLDWLNEPDSNSPVMSHNLLRKKLFPLLDAGKPYFLVVIDNLRLDQFRVIEPFLADLFHIDKVDPYFSILPTSTEFARNALFAGMMPAEIKKRYPDKWVDGEDEGSKNMHEAFFLNEQLKRAGRNLKTSYHKITTLHQGKQLVENASNLFVNDLNVVVYNFVDMLSHARSEMNVIKELADDDAAYRSITRSWFEHSPLYELMKKIAEKRVNMVITTDHGTIKVGEPVRIIGDRNTTTNLRYKEGKNLSYDQGDLFVIDKPEKAHLIKPYLSSTYVFATNDQYFCYPNNYHHFVNLYRNTFQHGGISLEEVIIPFVSLRPKQ
jgi:DNA-binding response OmpR family regulator